MLNNTHGDVISQQKDSPKSVESDSSTSSKPKSKRSSKGRVFLCTGYPGCNMSFTRSEHLARHKRKHTGERPFTCPYCSKNFSRLDNLRQHKQTVHAYETYLQRNGNSNDVYSGSQRGESEDKFQLDRTNASSSSSISSSSSKGRNDDHSLHHHHHYHPATPNNPLFSLNETGAFKSAAGIPQVGYSGVPGTMMSPPNSQSPHYHNQAYYMNGPSANHPHHPIQHGHQHLYPYQGQSQSHTAPQHQPSHSAPLYGQQYESQAPAHYPSQPPPVPPKPHQDNTLRIPKHQFKPKRRPRPLSLQHSFVNDPESESTSPVSMSSSLANNSGYRTAPANSTTFSTISKTSTSTTTTVISYPPAPKSASSVASLTPNLVSPLSPLFHQSFSQTTSRNNDRSSFGARSLHSLTMPSTTNFTIHSGGSRSSLPSIQHLPLNGNGDEDNNSIVGPISTISHNSLDGILKTRTDFANKMLPPLPQAAGDNTKTWLKGVLNDDGTVSTTSISPSTSDASCNDMDIKMEEVPSGQIPPNTTTTDILNAETTTATNPTDSSTMATSKNETANKILYSSKKPTINSLLSPTEHRKFS